MTTSARMVTLFAVLVGVFLMHGLPAQSCAAGAGSGDSMAVMVGVDHAGPTMGSGHGSPCVFTMPSRDQAPLLALALLIVVALLMAPWRPLLAGGPGRRGPPLFGARLLTVVCVSRT